MSNNPGDESQDSLYSFFQSISVMITMLGVFAAMAVYLNTMINSSSLTDFSITITDNNGITFNAITSELVFRIGEVSSLLIIMLIVTIVLKKAFRINEKDIFNVIGKYTFIISFISLAVILFFMLLNTILLSYAVIWFLFFLILSILFLKMAMNKKRNKDRAGFLLFIVCYCLFVGFLFYSIFVQFSVLLIIMSLVFYLIPIIRPVAGSLYGRMM